MGHTSFSDDDATLLDAFTGSGLVGDNVSTGTPPAAGRGAVVGRVAGSLSTRARAVLGGASAVTDVIQRTSGTTIPEQVDSVMQLPGESDDSTDEEVPWRAVGAVALGLIVVVAIGQLFTVNIGDSTS